MKRLSICAVLVTGLVLGSGGCGSSTNQPPGALGEDCASGAGCASGFCKGSVCSECAADGDCEANEVCFDDTAGVGYFVCQGGLGDTCTTGSDCSSGFCFNPPGPGALVCSECELDGDCPQGSTCNYSFLDGYAVCN